MNIYHADSGDRGAAGVERQRTHFTTVAENASIVQSSLVRDELNAVIPEYIVSSLRSDNSIVEQFAGSRARERERERKQQLQLSSRIPRVFRLFATVSDVNALSAWL